MFMLSGNIYATEMVRMYKSVLVALGTQRSLQIKCINVYIHFSLLNVPAQRLAKVVNTIIRLFSHSSTAISNNVYTS